MILQKLITVIELTIFPLFLSRTELFDLNKKTGTSFRKLNVLPLKVVPQLLFALNIKNSKVFSDFIVSL